MDTKILKLDTKILSIRGEQAKEIINREVINGMMTNGETILLNVRQCLLSLLPMSPAKGKETVVIWDLAIRIKNEKSNQIELTDEEFGIVKKVVSENVGAVSQEGNIPYYAPFIIAQLLKELKFKER